MSRDRAWLLFAMAVVAALVGVGLWIPAHWATDKSARFFTGYPAAHHALLLTLAFVLPGALSVRGLRPGSHSRTLNWLLLAQLGTLVGLWLPGRTLFALCAVLFLAVALWGLWPRGEQEVPARIGTVAFALGLTGAVFLLAVEATDFAAPYQLATSLLFRGSTVLIGVAALSGRLGIPRLGAQSSGPSLRTNLALSLFGASFGIEFVYAVLLRSGWPGMLPHLVRAAGGLWLLAEVVLPWWRGRAGGASPESEAVLAAPVYFPRLLALAVIGSLAIGFVAEALSPDSLAHTLHFAHIGATALLILLPEKQPLTRRSRWLLGSLVGLLLVAASTRATAQVWPQIYRSHLLYAAFLFLPALLGFAGLRIRELRFGVGSRP